MIDLNCNTADENTQTHASFSIPLLKNLLEPLRLLRAFQFVHITGPLDEQYTTDLCLSMCKKAPSFTESLLGVMHKKKNDQIAIKVRGNENRLFQTVKMYNTAMTGLKDRCSGFDWAVQSRLRIGHFAPSFTDIGLHIAYMEFLYRLRLNLASTHSKLEQWWQCRKWSGHAMMIVHEDPLLPVRNNASDNYYAHACRLNALSNNKLGRWEEAVTSIREAVKISPDLKQEVEEYERDLQKSKERQVKIVRVILTENRTKRNERSRVMRYPADFEKVKQRLKFIEESGEGM